MRSLPAACAALLLVVFVPPGERRVVVNAPISTLTALPGERVTVEALNRRWTWTAPQQPGLYPIRVDSIVIQAFVLVPYEQLRGEYLNGYRIGRYPRRALRGLDMYRPPAGFIEVTPANENVFVSQHFQLKQFVCKQAGGYPKYVVLNSQLLERLEQLLALANDAGITASTFHVMSGYRTPAYNRAIGNVQYSRHTWGSAADIFVDQDHDGRMDDLNRDGRSNAQDAAVLYALFDQPQSRGGLGKYEATATHGPFVHVDLRDRRARW
ncbi:MAG TPA: D-Ala-D-Ala carboxypeptidase family metallohydrolase [Gemmatimonadales bacterium]|nr:D-Ala-D-Ala carboxypeptidase family metallohydrolase [Gemmatimonadales bacterium]